MTTQSTFGNQPLPTLPPVELAAPGDLHTEHCDTDCYGGWAHAAQHLSF
jgi:hypothetical protein